MSLAFDKDGERFTFKPGTKMLKARMWKNPGGRGTCTAVLDNDGEQLFVPADCDYARFCRMVGGVPGLYRFDQCDQDGIAVEGAPPAYVTVEPTRNGASPSGDEGTVALLLASVRDLAATNAETTKTIVDRYASLMAATGQPLHALAPVPRVVMLPGDARSRSDAQMCDDDEDDDDDGEYGEHADADLSSASWIFEKLRPQIEPMLPALCGMLASKILELFRASFAGAGRTGPANPSPNVAPPPPAAAPRTERAHRTNAGPDTSHTGGTSERASDAVSEEREERSHAHVDLDVDASVSVDVSASADAPALDPSAAADANDADGAAAPAVTPNPANFAAAGSLSSVPSPSTAASSVSAPSTTTAPPVASASKAASPSPESPRAMATPMMGSNSRAVSPAPTMRVDATSVSLMPTTNTQTGTGGQARNANPAAPTPAQWQHLFAVRAKLSAQEIAIAQKVIERMPADLLTQWLSELSSRSVDDAVEVVRSLIRDARRRPGDIA